MKDPELTVERLLRSFRTQIWLEERCVLDPAEEHKLRKAIKELVIHRIYEHTPGEFSLSLDSPEKGEKPRGG